MKLAVCAFFMVCAASAFGQAAYLSNQVIPFRIPDNPQHASVHEMGREESLLTRCTSPYSYAQGERPVWEFGDLPRFVSLGEVARAVRKERLNAKRAEIVWEN